MFCSSDKSGYISVDAEFQPDGAYGNIVELRYDDATPLDDVVAGAATASDILAAGLLSSAVSGVAAVDKSGQRFAVGEAALNAVYVESAEFLAILYSNTISASYYKAISKFTGDFGFSSIDATAIPMTPAAVTFAQAPGSIAYANGLCFEVFGSAPAAYCGAKYARYHRGRLEGRWGFTGIATARLAPISAKGAIVSLCNNAAIEQHKFSDDEGVLYTAEIGEQARRLAAGLAVDAFMCTRVVKRPLSQGDTTEGFLYLVSNSKTDALAVNTRLCRVASFLDSAKTVAEAEKHVATVYLHASEEALGLLSEYEALRQRLTNAVFEASLLNVNEAIQAYNENRNALAGEFAQAVKIKGSVVSDAKHSEPEITAGGSLPVLPPAELCASFADWEAFSDNVGAVLAAAKGALTVGVEAIEVDGNATEALAVRVDDEYVKTVKNAAAEISASVAALTSYLVSPPLGGGSDDRCASNVGYAHDSCRIHCEDKWPHSSIGGHHASRWSGVWVNGGSQYELLPLKAVCLGTPEQPLIRIDAVFRTVGCRHPRYSASSVSDSEFSFLGARCQSFMANPTTAGVKLLSWSSTGIATPGDWNSVIGLGTLVPANKCRNYHEHVRWDPDEYSGTVAYPHAEDDSMDTWFGTKVQFVLSVSELSALENAANADLVELEKVKAQLIKSIDLAAGKFLITRALETGVLAKSDPAVKSGSALLDVITGAALTAFDAEGLISLCDTLSSLTDSSGMVLSAAERATVADFKRKLLFQGRRPWFSTDTAVPLAEKFVDCALFNVL